MLFFMMAKEGEDGLIPLHNKGLFLEKGESIYDTVTLEVRDTQIVLTMRDKLINDIIDDMALKMVETGFYDKNGNKIKLFSVKSPDNPVFPPGVNVKDVAAISLDGVYNNKIEFKAWHNLSIEDLLYVKERIEDTENVKSTQDCC